MQSWKLDIGTLVQLHHFGEKIEQIEKNVGHHDQSMYQKFNLLKKSWVVLVGPRIDFLVLPKNSFTSGHYD